MFLVENFKGTIKLVITKHREKNITNLIILKAFISKHALLIY